MTSLALSVLAKLGAVTVRFIYEAVDKSGLVVRGELQAETRTLAMERLAGAGQLPILLREGSKALASLEHLLERFDRAGNVFVTIRELAILLSSGLPIERALHVLQSLSSNTAARLRIGHMLEQVRAGQPFSDAVRPYMPRTLAHHANLIAAGEASGHLPEIMMRLSAILARRKVLRGRMLTSLAYPAFLLLTLVAVLWIVFADVVPRLVPMFAKAKGALPLSTRLLISTSNLLNGYGSLFIVGLLVLLALALFAVRQPGVQIGLSRYFMTSKIFLRVPREYEAACFCRNVEGLLAGGLSIDRALLAARTSTGSRWFARQLEAVQAQVEAGVPLGGALSSSAALPPLVVEFATVGEETGRLSAMLGEAAGILEHDVEVRLDRLSAVILPVATLGMGLLVAGIMGAVVSGLLAVNDLAL